jgi:hypothetical protein
MKGEIVNGLYTMNEVLLPDGGKIIRADSGAPPPWYEKGNLHFRNHNIFRLDANNQVVWQVQRVETLGQLNWEVANRMAKEEDPTCEGYMDPFINMGEQYHETRFTRARYGNQETLYFDSYAPGRLLGLRTHWWAYNLDPQTGIATCTGEQCK